MASENRAFDLRLAPEQTYQLIREAGRQLPGFDRTGENQQEGFIKFERVLGWSNPMTVEVRLQITSEQSCKVQLTAKLLALADPMGFMKGVLDMFQGHITGCAQAAAQGQPWPPPPARDKKGLKSTMIILGVVAVVVIVPFFLLLIAAVVF